GHDGGTVDATYRPASLWHCSGWAHTLASVGMGRHACDNRNAGGRSDRHHGPAARRWCARLVTYARTIPARPAPENSDPTAAALLDSMAGRVIHSASWTSPDARGAAPVAFYVSIEALENPDPRTPSARVSLEFQIDQQRLNPWNAAAVSGSARQARGAARN